MGLMVGKGVASGSVGLGVVGRFVGFRVGVADGEIVGFEVVGL